MIRFDQKMNEQLETPIGKLKKRVFQPLTKMFSSLQVGFSLLLS